MAGGGNRVGKCLVMNTNYPLGLRTYELKSKIIFALSDPAQGAYSRIENLELESFICVHSASDYTVNGKAYIDYVAETASWAYRNIHSKPFYIKDKRLLIHRLLKTINLVLWQTMRNRNLSSPIKSEIMIVTCTSKYIWYGSIGNWRLDFFQSGTLVYESRHDPDLKSYKGCAGLNKKIPYPPTIGRLFNIGDALVISRPEILDTINREKYIHAVSRTGITRASLNRTRDYILDLASDISVRDRCITIVKKVPLDNEPVTTLVIN